MSSVEKPKIGRRSDIDWDAVQRDYRTARFTNRELAKKHGVSHQAVAKQAKNGNWTKDLGEAIKSATSARLVEELVNEEVAKSGQKVVDTVLLAAEVNAQIVLKHRERLTTLTEAAQTALAKVVALGDEVSDIREAGVYSQAVNTLVTANKTLIDQERRAYGLDDEGEKSNESYEDALRAAIGAAGND